MACSGSNTVSTRHGIGEERNMAPKINGTGTSHLQHSALKEEQGPQTEIQSLRAPSLSRAYGWEALGQLIVHWRMEHGLSAQELADDAGFSIDVVRVIESGRAMPSARHLLTVAELLEVSFEKLLRLVGLVRTEDDGDLLQAALQFLVRTSHVALGSAVAKTEALKFMRVLRRD